MSRKIALAAALAAAAASPASAGSWGVGVGVGFGPPVLYEAPPPVVYYEQPAILHAPPPPPAVYYEAPVYEVIPPPPPAVLHMEAPEDVLANLSEAGYRDLGPMARRGSVYRLKAVNPYGDTVELEISIFTGEIETSRILHVRRSAPPPAPAPVAVAPVPAAAPPPPAQRSKAAAAPAPARATASRAEAPTAMRDRLQDPATQPDAAPTGRDPLVVY